MSSRPQGEHYHLADDLAGGPGPTHFEDKRLAYKTFPDDSSEHYEEDSWEDYDKRNVDKRLWSGRTVFYELGPHPQVYFRDAMEERRLPSQAPTPKEERELHQLTHMTYRSWCKVCLRSKARGNYHKQQHDRQPLLQAERVPDRQRSEGG